MNKYIAEFLGTFFLVLTIGCTGIGASSGVIAPLAIGAALMVMVFAGGHISGAHYNPAVTLGVLIRGRLNAADVVPYIVAQLAAAASAALAVKFLRAGIDVTAISPKIGPALLAEFLFTFALVYVVLNTATVDAARDRELRARVAKMADDHRHFITNDDGSVTIVVGFQAWPFPIPLVKTDAGWQFNTDAGIE